MRQFFDIYGSPEFPRIILKNIEEENIALVQEYDITEFTPTLQFTGTSTISFVIEDSVEEPQIEYYDNIILNNRIYVDGLDKERMFVIKECEETTDNVTKTKNVMAIAIEADMNNPLTLLAGTYTFFDPLKPEESLMHIITKQNAEWSIGEIDVELSIMKFKFEEITMPTYQFLMTNVSEAYECVFSYDEINKKINATTNGKSTKNKNIVLKYDDIIESVTKTPNAEKFTTAMEVVGGGGLSIATVNPLGTNIIYNFNGVKDRMSDALRSAVTTWDDKVKANQKDYADKLTVLNDRNAEMQTLKTQLVDIQSIRDAKKEAMSVYVETGNTEDSNYSSLVREYNKAINDEIAKEVEISAKQLEVDAVFAELRLINESLALTNHFTPEQIILLSRYIYTTKVTDENYIQTDKMSNKEIQDMAQKLYDKYTLVLEKHCKELVSVAVSMSNFMRCLERRDYTNNLSLGDVITIQMMDDTYADLTVLEVTWNHDDIETMSMTFADGLRLIGGKYENADNAIRQSIIDATVKGELIGMLEASKNNSFLNDIQEGGLNANLAAIKTNDKEEIKIDNTGLMARSYDKDLNIYDNEQLWLVHNQILLTDDAWETVKCAIGKLLFADGTTWGYGISSSILMGKLICGQRCIIQSGNTYVTIDEFGIKVENGAIEIKDNNGNAFIDGEKITLGDGKVGMTTYSDGLSNVPDLRIWAGSNDYDSRDTALFRVYEDGRVVMVNAEVHGDVMLCNGGLCSCDTSPQGIAAYFGKDHDNKDTAPTRITNDGTLYSEKGEFKTSLKVGGKDVLTANENLDALTMDNMHLANSATSAMIQANAVFGKSFFAESINTNFSDWIYGYNDSTVRRYKVTEKERDEWRVDELSITDYEVLDIDGMTLCYNKLYGDEWQDWYTLTNPITKAISWSPNIYYEQSTVLISDEKFYVVKEDTYPQKGFKTLKEALDSLIVEPVTADDFHVKLKKVLKSQNKSFFGFDENDRSVLEPVFVMGAGIGVGDSGKFKMQKKEKEFVQEYIRSNGKKSGFVLDDSGTKYYDKDGVLKEVGSGGGGEAIYKFDHMPTEAELDDAGVQDGCVVLVEVK